MWFGSYHMYTDVARFGRKSKTPTNLVKQNVSRVGNIVDDWVRKLVKGVSYVKALKVLNQCLESCKVGLRDDFFTSDNGVKDVHVEDGDLKMISDDDIEECTTVGKVCISTKLMEPVKEVVNVHVVEKMFMVGVKEFAPWIPPSDNMGDCDEDGSDGDVLDHSINGEKVSEADMEVEKEAGEEEVASLGNIDNMRCGG
ncbi:hypothetical protein L1987_68190 [Smallanthus sonchifolius]|uniref:Uncharacterized protein n=1 Tax=Smallanthus sonchifolius TaxID=185202 RepID=A0ACB9B403_9ASTR|nr:hypothetical protein L1987_68190 [Smallanthus sonchifolius]